MPTIDCFNGIKVSVFNGEHRPPHFHAIYNEFEVLVQIQDGEIYAGYLPKKQLKQVADWLLNNSVWILRVFYELNPNLK